jgi:stage V sporulation protein B
MSKAAGMAKISAKGGFHLFWGLLVSTIVSSIATILVARLLGSDSYGLYGIVLIAPNLIGVFRDWGINSAIVKYTAQFRAEDKESKIRSVLFSGMIFEVISGIVLSVFCFVLAGYVATNIFHRPEIVYLIQVASISILANGIVTAATATFIGIERMELNGLMLIIQSIIRTVIMITLVILGFGASGAVIGYTIALIMAALIGGSLVWIQFRKLSKNNDFKLEIKSYLRMMLTYSTPLSISNILGGFQNQYYTFLLPIYYITDNTAIGNFGIASTFVVLISFFATPIEKVLFPAFSKLNPKTDKETLQSVFQSSVKYASLLVIPVAAMVLCLAQPAVTTLFGETYSTAPFFLALLTINYVYTAFGSLSTGNFISSQGKTNYILYLTLVSVAAGLPLGYVLIMNFGILGLIVTSTVTAIPTTIISLYWMKKHFGLTVDWPSSLKILMSSAITAALTYTLISQLEFSSLIRLVIGVVFFVLVFVLVSLLTKTINKTDLENLRGMTSGLGLIGKIINRILNLLEKAMIILKY